MQTPVTIPITHYDCPPGQRKPPMLEPASLKPAAGTFLGMKVGAAVAQDEVKPNCIAATFTRDAENLIDFLGLDRKSWMVFGVGQALLGHRFAKTLMLYQPSFSTLEQDVLAEWIGRLKSKSQEFLLL